MEKRKSGDGGLEGQRLESPGLDGVWTVRRHVAAKPPVGVQRIRVGVEPPVTNLPVLPARLVGRSAAVARLRDLAAAYRLVTLTGPGGIGKTCLALKVASRIVGEFASGGWVVELASLSEPSLVASAVANMLGLELSSRDRSAEAVARVIGEGGFLLILDNCEHLIDAVAMFAETLLRLCPHVAILATSREVLRVEGEYVYRVAPLAVPSPEQLDSHEILNCSAVQLFIARTTALTAGFPPRAESLEPIAEICRQLDGIPLAIELAAARAATLGVARVAASLGDRFAVLTGDCRNPVERHRTMLAALDWSYQLLSGAEQCVLRHLAIFAAGFTLEMAAAVVRGAAATDASMLEDVANLVGKSLVIFDGAASPCRWRMLETIRAFALEKLAEAGELHEAQRRRALYFRDLFSPQGHAAPWRLSAAELLVRARELDNVRASLDWCFSGLGDAGIGKDLTAACLPVWLYQGLAPECREQCERALQAAEPDGATNALRQARLRAGRGAALIGTMGTADHTKAVLSGAIEEAESLGDLDTGIVGLFRLIPMLSARGEHDDAWTAAERLARIAHKSTAPDAVVAADRITGLLLLGSGRLDAARRCFERVLQFAPRGEAEHSLYWYHSDHRAVTRAMLARTLCLQGYAEQAQGQAEASLEELPGPNKRLSVCRVIAFGMIRVALLRGNFVGAEQAIARLNDVAKSAGAPFWQVEGRFLDGMLLVARGEFARGAAVLSEAFETCGRAGRRGPNPEFAGALAEALCELGRPDEALVVVDDALPGTLEERSSQAWYAPELLRIKGEILLRQWADRCAETAAGLAGDCFRRAGGIAREQGSLLWELRIALSFARMQAGQGRAAEARQILLPVYARFAESFDMPCLRAARALLEQ